jgi:hypothetical protein
MDIRRPLSFALIGLSLALSAPASATTTLTYVATSGSDEATCTLAEPCRTFTRALTQTSAGGVVTVLDSGDYDAVSITQSVSLVAPPGVQATIVVTSGDGITVNASGIAVVLRGLTVKGTGTGYGISFQSGVSLHVEHMVVVNPSYRALNMSAAGELYVTDTVFRDGANPAVVSSSATATFVRVQSVNSSGYGFNFEGGKITLRDVVVAGSYAAGIYANTNEGGTVKLTVERSTVRGNGGTGVVAAGSGTHVVITGSTVTQNTGDAVDATNSATVVIGGSAFTQNTDYAFYFATSGVIKSTGDNTVEGNALGGTLGGSLTSLSKL